MGADEGGRGARTMTTWYGHGLGSFDLIARWLCTSPMRSAGGFAAAAPPAGAAMSTHTVVAGIKPEAFVELLEPLESGVNRVEPEMWVVFNLTEVQLELHRHRAVDAKTCVRRH